MLSLNLSRQANKFLKKLPSRHAKQEVLEILIIDKRNDDRVYKQLKRKF